MDSFKKGFTKVIVKEVKNYSGRLRINITSKDGLNADDHVVLIMESEYNQLMSDVRELSAKVEMLEHQQQNFEEMLEISLKPIYAEHDKQIQKKDDIIESKDNELKHIRGIMHKFSVAISGLSLWELIRGRHKDLITDFDNGIWVNVSADQVAEIKKISESED